MDEPSKQTYANPTKEMSERWIKILKKNVPTVDIIDIALEVATEKSSKKQFEPEYSYDAYNTMLREESAVGDYTSDTESRRQVSA